MQCIQKAPCVVVVVWLWVCGNKSATSETPGGEFTYICASKRHQSINHESHGRVSCALKWMYSKPAHHLECKSTRLIPTLCTFWLVIFFFYPSSLPSPNCHKGGNPARFQAAYWRQTINHWQISMAEMRTRVPYLLGLPGEKTCLCLRFISASTSHSQLFGCCHNKSIKLPLQDCVQLLLLHR